MRSFKDKNGITWDISVDAPSIKRVKQQAGIFLPDILKGDEGSRTFWADLVLVVDVLYVLCKEQCDKRGTSDEDFGKSLSGDSLDDAMKKMIDEIIDFFPNSHQRTTLRKQVAKAETMTEEMLKEVEKQIDSLTIDSLKSSLKPQPSQE